MKPPNDVQPLRRYFIRSVNRAAGAILCLYLAGKTAGEADPAQAKGELKLPCLSRKAGREVVALVRLASPPVHRTLNPTHNIAEDSSEMHNMLLHVAKERELI